MLQHKMKSHLPKDFYKSLFDRALDGLAYCQMIFDNEGEPADFTYIYANDNFEKMLGVKKVAGRNAADIVPGMEKYNRELFDAYKRVSLTGVPERFEVHIEALESWFLASLYCPKKNFFISVLENITNRKLTEENLINSKTAVQNILEDLSDEKAKLEMAKAKEEAILFSIGDGLLATDEEGNITLINKTAEKLLGRTSKDVEGKYFADVLIIQDEKGSSIPLDKRPVFSALAQGATTTTSTSTGTSYYYVRSDKTRFPVAMVATPVFLDGKVIGTIEVFRDITREKEIDKAKTEFVSLASHQLRTPLTTIGWYTEMILKGDVGKVSESQKKYLEEIYKGDLRMVELVNTLLDVSRIEMGTFMVELSPTDIVALALGALDEQRTKIERKKLTVSKNFGGNVPKFAADPKLIYMALQNLLNNAVEYTPEGGNIGIEISIDDKKAIVVKVSDNGYGIPKNQQDKIFTRFFRADNVKDKDTSGTGLGLYMVKSIIEKFGGKIWFESELDKGSAFYVSIPYDSVKNAGETVPPTAGSLG